MPAPLPTGIPFGRYVLVERVATGGMAEVWRGIFSPAPDVQKAVAVKRILPHLARDPDFLTLFRQEAGVCAALSHANVVQLLDMGDVDGEPYLALEFVHGRNLRQLLRRTHELRERIPEAIALTIAMEAAKGLAHAHAKKDETGVPLGIVHRDVSPANILVSFDGDVKIADFGIARAVAYASTTSVGQVRGKAAYLSPEQIEGRPIDGRSDQFALGAVLWELLTGSKLFPGDSESEIMNKVRSVDAPPPSAVAAVSRAADAIASRALARDRGSRFPDANALVREIALALAATGSVTTTADVGAYLRGVFADELEAERTAAMTRKLARPGDPLAQGRAHAAAVPPSPYADVDLDEEPIKPLPIEERRKLFDLPPPRASAAPSAGAPVASVVAVADEAIELDDTARRPPRERAGLKRIRVTRSGVVTGFIAGVARLAAAGTATAAVLGVAILLIYR